MPNDSSLPRPNIPQPAQAGVSQGQPVNAPNFSSSTLLDGSEPTTDRLSVPTSSQSSPPPPSLPQITVGGLDPQFPGGAPPDLNELGQVENSSVISQKQEVPTYDQPQAPPESTLQKIQTSGASNQGARTNSFGGGDGLGAINVASGTAQDQVAPSSSLSRQQAIQASSQTNQESAADSRQISSSHPNLGLNIPRLTSADVGGSSSDSSGDDLPAGGARNAKETKSKQTKSSQSAGPIVAKPKKPIVKYLIFGLGAALVLGLVVFGITRILGDQSSHKDNTSISSNDSSTSQGSQGTLEQTPGKGVVLTYWGLWEPESVMKEVFEDFNKKTGITVDYRQQSHRDYRTRLQSAIGQGTGPDVFRFHATWVPMLKNELSPIPSRVMSVAEYEKAFYPIFSRQLQNNGQLIGIPLMYDGLGLYYNKTILETANEEVPTTWGEVRVLAEKLTVRSGSQVERGGIALGNTTNVEHFSDILGLLIFQNGGDPLNPVTSEVRDAIDFYALFGRTNPVYGTNLPSSTVAFARGEVAMMIAPSWRVHEILHINPELNFDIAPIPKLGDSDQSWASYWAEGVSAASKHQDEAWQLLKYLSTPEVLRKLYSAQSEIRAFGEIFPRIDMSSELLGKPYVSAFIEDAPKAVSAPLCSYTHDAGINDNIIDYYKDALNSASERSLNESQLQTLGRGVSQVLGQFR